MLKSLTKNRAYIDLENSLKIIEVLDGNFRSLTELKSFFNDEYFITQNLKDTLILFERIGVVKTVGRNEFKRYNVCEVYREITLEKLKEVLLLNLKNNAVVQTISIDSQCYIKIPTDYFAVRNLLLSENIILKSEIKQLYRLSNEYKKIIFKGLRKISKEEFLRNLKNQNEIGEKAEKYIIELENLRLNNAKNIIHTALIDNNAGYDIASYISNESTLTDKFIEVKCFSEKKDEFYVSKNEIKISAILGDNYYLYLVDSNFDKEPIVIQNPYEKIFNNSNIFYEIESRKYNINSIIEK